MSNITAGVQSQTKHRGSNADQSVIYVNCSIHIDLKSEVNFTRSANFIGMNPTLVSHCFFFRLASYVCTPEAVESQCEQVYADSMQRPRLRFDMGRRGGVCS